MSIVSYWTEVRIDQFTFGDIAEKMTITELPVDKKRTFKKKNFATLSTYRYMSKT